MKKQPTLTDEEHTKIQKKYLPTLGNLAAIDFQIALALDHDAAKKAGNSGSWNLYVQNWLNKCPKITQAAPNPTFTGVRYHRPVR